MRRPLALLVLPALVSGQPSAQAVEYIYRNVKPDQPAVLAPPTANPGGGDAQEPTAPPVPEPDPAFVAAPQSGAYEPGSPLRFTPPAMVGTTAATTYGLLSAGQDITGTFPDACPGLGFATPTGVIEGTPMAYCAMPSLAYRANTPGKPSAVSETFSLTVGSPLAVSGNPGAMSLRAGTSLTTAARLSGNPFGGLTWKLLGPAGSPVGIPAWLQPEAGACAPESMSCTVRAQPAADVVPGVYPPSGSFTIGAEDVSGTQVRTSGFAVTVLPSAMTVAPQVRSFDATQDVAATIPGIAASGGSKPYLYTLTTVSGIAPANAAVSQTDGAVSFTANAGETGTWVYKVGVASAGEAGNAGETGLQTITIKPPVSSVPKPTTVTLGASAAVFGPEANLVTALYDGSTATGVSANLGVSGLHIKLGWGGQSYRVGCITLKYEPIPYTYVALRLGANSYVAGLGPSGRYTYILSSPFRTDGIELFKGDTASITLKVTDFRVGDAVNGQCITP